MGADRWSLGILLLEMAGGLNCTATACGFASAAATSSREVVEDAEQLKQQSSSAGAIIEGAASETAAAGNSMSGTAMGSMLWDRASGSGDPSVEAAAAMQAVEFFSRPGSHDAALTVLGAPSHAG